MSDPIPREETKADEAPTARNVENAAVPDVKEPQPQVQEPVAHDEPEKDEEEEPVVIAPSRNSFTVVSPKLIVPNAPERAKEPQKRPVSNDAPRRQERREPDATLAREIAARRAREQAAREASNQLVARKAPAEQKPDPASKEQPKEEEAFQAPELAPPPEFEAIDLKREKPSNETTFTRIATGEREEFSLEATAPAADRAHDKPKPLPMPWEEFPIPQSSAKPKKKEPEPDEEEDLDLPPEEPQEQTFLGKMAHSFKSLFKSVNQ